MTDERWPEMPWWEAVQLVERITLRIHAGDSLGTGFVVSLGKGDKESYLMIATAWHVVHGVIGNDKPLLFMSADGKYEIGRTGNQCTIWRLGEDIFDTALIAVRQDGDFIKQADLRPIPPVGTQLRRGVTIGCLGFPGIAYPEMCFFKGVVSGYRNDPPTYLLDAVVVNGVSGGPAFDNKAQLIGLVSAYLPNRVNSSTTLPGLAALIPINAIRYWMEHEIKAKVL